MKNEKKLIKRCIAGNVGAQQELYDRFAPKMLSVCFRYAGNIEDAKDIVQEGFIKVFEYMKQFGHKGSFEGWMRKIMVHTAIHYMKSNTSLYAHQSVDNESVYKVSYTEAVQLEADDLMKMVSSLPPAYRSVFNLFAIEGYTHKEVAGMLNIAEGTSKSNLADARRLLQKKLAATIRPANQKIGS